jgi:SAM-dependent methyltransferase
MHTGHREAAERVQNRLPSATVGSPEALPNSHMPDSGLIEDLPPRELLRGLFHLFFGREPVLTDDGAYVIELETGAMTPRQLVEWLIHSAEWSHTAPMTELGPSLHYGRGVFVRSLPRARRILDIGGASLGDPAGALVVLGYPYEFEELVIVDLPSDERHPHYQEDARPASRDIDQGRVTYRYHSMTDLTGLETASFDLVYSGQSIEHVTRKDAEMVVAQVRRVLKPDGIFALDTPNSRLTRLQSPTAFIDPDHKHEYSHSELSAMLRGHGFSITRAYGINYGGRSLELGVFDHGEVTTRRGLFDEVQDCYLLAYVCRRQRSNPETVWSAVQWRMTRPTGMPRRLWSGMRRRLEARRS